MKRSESNAQVVQRHLPVLHEQEKPGLVRLTKPLQASMSKTDLLLKCQYWASPTVRCVPENNEVSTLNFALRRGRAFHKCMEIYLESHGTRKPNFKVIAKKFSVDPKMLEDFYRRAKDFIDELLRKRGWLDEERLVEKKMVYDPFSDRMRFLTSTKERDYSDRISTELPGTGDLAVIPNKRMMVLDWKSGTSSYTAQDNGQLLSLATGLSRHYQIYEAVVFIVRIDEDFIEPSEGLLTAKHLDEHRERMRLSIQNALSPNPSMTIGSHCQKFYCPAIEVCPAHAGPLSLRDAIEGVLTREQKGHQYARYQAAKKLIEKIGDFWHRDVEMNGPIYLDNGQRVVLKPVHKETLSKASIRRAMSLVEAEALIKQLRDLGALDETDYTQLDAQNDPSSKR